MRAIFLGPEMSSDYALELRWALQDSAMTIPWINPRPLCVVLYGNLDYHQAILSGHKIFSSEWKI